MDREVFFNCIILFLKKRRQKAISITFLKKKIHYYVNLKEYQNIGSSSILFFYLSFFSSPSLPYTHFLSNIHNGQYQRCYRKLQRIC